MARFTINNFVVMAAIFLAVVLAFTRSADGSYDGEQQAAYYSPTKSPPPPPPSNPTCRKLLELCTSYGAYSCCGGFVCGGRFENLPVGVGVCTPSNQPPQLPAQECQIAHQLCQPYGDYSCCKGLTCVHPRTLPPVAGIEPEQLMLPPGVGICEPIKL
ncbi:uncharacterized protein LOC110723565 [Chenopodium quinoa]|uniref:uncharacterized protein LOC110723565 n=1 Tax=Chenopodium quinoa TaxID=63459 RepID=UPI000B7866AC|nr:uncharacterized protein LOC110723565 [Chenopodium quinoa]